MSDAKMEAFGQNHADNYDRTWEKLAPVMAGLHLLMQLLLAPLPEDARVLVVGAGTGAELLALARAFPRMRFTAVDPSAPMLEVARRKVEAAGFADRCSFHAGYLESLPRTDGFDAATAILVSQFMTGPGAREAFFKEIGERLRPAALLIHADLSAPDLAADYDRMMQVWTQQLIYAGLPPERAAEATSAWGKAVAVSRGADIEAVVRAAGFADPVAFFQSLFIRAWFSRAPGPA